MTALLLLGPATPMLFQGQEFAASSPFLYFADLPPELAKLVRAGRAEFLAQFPSLAGAEAQAALPDPADRLTFERSKLDLGERERHAGAYALHLDLLRSASRGPGLPQPGCAAASTAPSSDPRRSSSASSASASSWTIASCASIWGGI